MLWIGKLVQRYNARHQGGGGRNRGAELGAVRRRVAAFGLAPFLEEMHVALGEGDGDALGVET